MKHLLPSECGRRMLVLLLLLLALPCPTFGAPASIGNHLVRIQKLLGETQYEQALDEVEVARQEPHGTDEDVTLSLYEGILLYELRRKDEAKVAFRRAFLLRPRARLPVAVSPKIQADVDLFRRQAEDESKGMPRPAPPPQEIASPAGHLEQDASSSPSGPRRAAWIPAVAGGTAVVLGGLSWNVARGDYHRLRDADPGIQSQADVDRIRVWGQTWQAVGCGLVGVGVAGLATAVGMSLWGGPEQEEPAVSLSTTGTSVILQGRWP